MTERPDDKAVSTAGLLLAQQVVLEALVRHDAIGYHQLHETLQQALQQLQARGEVPPSVLAPLQQVLAALDRQHRPRPAGEPPEAIDWTDWLRENGLI